MRPDMHPHGTWGTVGAAAAVAKLLGYDVGKMRETINVASSLTLAADLAQERELKIKELRSRLLLEPLEVRLIPVSYATAADMAARAKEMVSPRGSLTVVCDGMYSTLRNNLSTPDIKLPSYFVGLLLTGCRMPVAHQAVVAISLLACLLMI